MSRGLMAENTWLYAKHEALRWGSVLRDIVQIIKGIWDTFVKIKSIFRDMVA